MKLPVSFYQRSDVVKIARDLLGKLLVTVVDGQISSGLIVETEAYASYEKGSHAFKGKTERNKVMFDEGGISYVYLCYGIHHMFNVVTNRAGKAEAILIRALQPIEGVELMMRRMKTSSPKRITSGPGKLAKAMGIDRSYNGLSLGGNELWIEEREIISARSIVKSPRIGIDYAGKDALLPWRFSLKKNDWVSK